MQKNTRIELARLGYTYLIFGASHLQSAFLLSSRIVWGFEVFETASGKLFHIEKPVAYFTSLAIPFPVENAYLVGASEMLGGILLALGLLTRVTAIPLIIDFIVACTRALRRASSQVDWQEKVKGWFQDWSSLGWFFATR